jgi:hypothetical protein
LIDNTIRKPRNRQICSQNVLFPYFIILTFIWEYYFLFSLLTPCCFKHCYFPKISNIEHCHFYKCKVNTKTLPLTLFDHTMHIWNFISYDIIEGKWKYKKWKLWGNMLYTWKKCTKNLYNAWNIFPDMIKIKIFSPLLNWQNIWICQYNVLVVRIYSLSFHTVKIKIGTKNLRNNIFHFKVKVYIHFVQSYVLHMFIEWHGKNIEALIVINFNEQLRYNAAKKRNAKKF